MSSSREKNKTLTVTNSSSSSWNDKPLTLKDLQEAYDKIMDTPVCADFSDYRNGKLLANCEKDYHDDPLYQALTMAKLAREDNEEKYITGNWVTGNIVKVKLKERYVAVFYDETALSKECPDKEENHEGQIYNPYSDSWSWL